MLASGSRQSVYAYALIAPCQSCFCQQAFPLLICSAIESSSWVGAANVSSSSSLSRFTDVVPVGGGTGGAPIMAFARSFTLIQQLGPLKEWCSGSPHFRWHPRWKPSCTPRVSVSTQGLRLGFLIAVCLCTPAPTRRWRPCAAGIPSPQHLNSYWIATSRCSSWLPAVT